MGAPDTEWGLPELRGATRESLIELLDQAAEVGLLSSHGSGYYTIHPALPWFFHGLFTGFYNPPSAVPNLQLRAFVKAMGELGNYYHSQYNEGKRDVINALSAKEANLLHARRLARTHGWWDGAIGAMQGLDELYGHTGRRAEWRRLVEEIVPDFVDLPRDDPLPGKEMEWSLVAGYRVRLARDFRRWDEAERIQRVCVDWCRRCAEAASGISFQSGSPHRREAYATLQNLDGVHRNAVRSLAVSLEQLGKIQRERHQPDCAASFEDALAIAEAINDRAEAAICSLDLGHVFPVWRRYRRRALVHRA
jgi:hypothetical protein